jgi:enoyl-CoA hydratase/carnithine racemase
MTEKTTDGVIVEDRDGGVRLITLSRPAVRNAIDGPMFAALDEALRRGDADPAIGAIVVAGAGGAFSSGHDRGAFAELWPQTADGVIARLLTGLPRMTTPFLAALDGAAVGIGATMTLHCDMVFAAPRTVLRFPFIDLGIVPEAGSTVLLPARVGRLAALDLILTGRPVEAAEAAALGLVTRVVDGRDVVEAALEAAASIAARPREAVRETLRLLKAPRGAETEEAIRREIDALNRLIPQAVAKLKR